MDHREDLYLAGDWRPSRGEELIAVIDPSTEQCIATIRESSESDIDDAVKAAQAALPVLAEMDIESRAKMLLALADALEQKSTALASAISREMGMPAHLTLDHQVRPAINTFRVTAEVLIDLEFQERVGHSLVRRGPVGVVAAITPWNYPLLQIASKIGPALAAGCSVVLKPSEIAPLDAFLLAEAISEAGIPAGAINLVFGTGAHVGEALIRHPLIDLVSLTGSTRAGRRVAEIAAARVTRVALELGGKSASVVLDDGDLSAAVTNAVQTVMTNSGQTCTALTRLLVPLDRLSEAEHLVADAMARYRVGPSDNENSDLGPLSNAAQAQRVIEHLDRAELDGSRKIWSADPGSLPQTGFFAPPTAFTATDPATPVVQQEIFGPVLVLQPYLNDDDAIELANGTEYGLAAAVWGADTDRAIRFADRVEAGTIDINGAEFNSRAPFGGRKQSGIGRELGAHGIFEFTELKTIQLPKGL